MVSRRSAPLGGGCRGEVGGGRDKEKLVPRGSGWKGRCWDAIEKGYEEKLAVVTDLEEEEAEVAWYQMRL